MTTNHTTGRRRAAALAVLVALVTVLIGAPTGAAGGRAAAPRQDGGEGSTGLKAEYDEVLGAEAALLQKLDDITAAKDQATAELATLAGQTQAMQLQLLDASSELEAAEALATQRAAERTRAEARVDAAQDRLRAQIVASYVSGGDDGGVIEALLAAENGEEYGQVLTFGKAVTDGTQELVDELEAARKLKRKADRAAKDARAAARTHRDDVSAATAFLATARDQKQTLVDEQNAQLLAESATLQEIRSRKVLVESRINSLSRASDGVQQILAELQRGQPDFVPGAGFTIDNPVPGVRVSSPFGMRHHPILNIDRLHAGCDLGAPTGTEIHAAADGFVVIAGERGGYGNATVIDHGNSLATLYGHQSRILVSPGQQVRRGDVIGLVGSTGLSTGPHLHFETRIKGVPVDPEGIVDFARTPVYDDEAAPGGG